MCQKVTYQDWHQKFLVSCKYCRESYCKACKAYNTAREVLFKSLDDTAKEYVQNFIQDFLNLSPASLQEHYQVTETVRVPKE